MFAFVAFTIVREHEGRFLFSGMSLWRMRKPCAYFVFALCSKLGLRVGRPVGVIAVAAPWPMGTQPPLATLALMNSCGGGGLIRRQPHSQVLSPTRRETLVGSGHVSPRIWEITNKRLGGGADKCEICLYEAWTSRSVETAYPTLSKGSCFL